MCTAVGQPPSVRSTAGAKSLTSAQVKSFHLIPVLSRTAITTETGIASPLSHSAFRKPLATSKPPKDSASGGTKDTGSKGRFAVEFQSRISESSFPADGTKLVQ